MDKRSLYAVIMMVFILFLWTFVQKKYSPQTPVKPVTQESQKEKTGSEAETITKKIVAGASLDNEAVPSIKRAVPGKEILVETQNYSAVFTTEDARLKHFRLKKYEDRVKETALVLKVKKLFKGIFGGKNEEPKIPEPVDLVNTKELEQFPLGLPSLASNENWQVDKEQLRLLEKGEKGSIVFSKRIGRELKIFKQFNFSSDQYVLTLQVKVQNNSQKKMTNAFGLEWIGKAELAKLFNEGNKDYGLRYSFFRNQKVEKNSFDKTSTGCVPSCGQQKVFIDPFQKEEKGDIKWFSFGGEYFTALIIPSSSKETTLSIKGTEKNIVKTEILSPEVTIPARGENSMEYLVYLGPKDESLLKSIGYGAEKVVDFGKLTFIAKPILWFVRATHHVTKNYGIDIILLSILMKIIFLPLMQISMKSMKNMQKVQPEIKKLQEQYKNDKTKLQQEMMLLYKRRKINPMSGCLPMLIQIPVFFALYNALQNGIEMRHAPFFFWIMDLSGKDPIYITPIVMGVTMFIQQKMTPMTAADPAQAKMFMFMPIMFTFFFLSMPSGLVIYWLIQNVLSIAHQYYMNKHS